MKRVTYALILVMVMALLCGLPLSLAVGWVDNASQSATVTVTAVPAADDLPPPPPPPPPPLAVGGEVYSINKVSVLAPWLGLILILAIGGGIFALRRRRAH